MLENDGEVITDVIQNRGTLEIMPNIQEHVLPETEIHTDELAAYQAIPRVAQNYTHKTVEHVSKEYVGPEGQTTNAIEGFFMHLKRTIKGTHIWVSPKHLHSYLGEAEFIYNRRNDPHRILNDLLYCFPKG